MCAAVKSRWVFQQKQSARKNRSLPLGHKSLWDKFDQTFHGAARRKTGAHLERALSMFKFQSAANSSLVILGGNSNAGLATEIAEQLGTPMADVICDRFPEGEIHVQICENVRGKDVSIVQSTCTPPNDNLMELLVLVDAARRASAKRITAVLPFFGYARQDRKDKPRVPITAKLVANLITTSGANRVLTMDLHSGQIQGFF